MASAKEKPLIAQPADYDGDFYARTYEQANLLRTGRLREAAGDIAAEAYALARERAADETDLPLDTFPILCPWTLEQIRDPDFLPDQG